MVSFSLRRTTILFWYELAGVTFKQGASKPWRRSLLKYSSQRLDWYNKIKHTEHTITWKYNDYTTTATNGAITLSSNSICLMCCGSVVQKAVRQSPQQIDKKSTTNRTRGVLWVRLTGMIGFCLTGPISLCLDSFSYVLCVLSYVACMCRIVTWWGGPGGIEAHP